MPSVDPCPFLSLAFIKHQADLGMPLTLAKRLHALACGLWHLVHLAKMNELSGIDTIAGWVHTDVALGSVLGQSTLDSAPFA